MIIAPASEWPLIGLNHDDHGYCDLSPWTSASDIKSEVKKKPPSYLKIMINCCQEHFPSWYTCVCQPLSFANSEADIILIFVINVIIIRIIIHKCKIVILWPSSQFVFWPFPEDLLSWVLIHISLKHDWLPQLFR